MTRALSLLLLASCATAEVRTSPVTLTTHADELRAGSAVIPNEIGAPVRVAGSQTVELVEPTGRKHRMSVNEVITRCTGPDDPCHDDRVVLSTSRHVSSQTKAFLAVTGVLAGVTGLIVCTFECSSPGNAIAGTALGVLAVFSLVAVVEIGRGFGRLARQ